MCSLGEDSLHFPSPSKPVVFCSTLKISRPFLSGNDDFISLAASTIDDNFVACSWRRSALQNQWVVVDAKQVYSAPLNRDCIQAVVASRALANYSILKKSGKWMKFSLDDKVLFEKDLGHSFVESFGVGDHTICFVGENCAKFCDIKYGMEMFSVELSVSFGGSHSALLFSEMQDRSYELILCGDKSGSKSQKGFSDKKKKDDSSTGSDSVSYLYKKIFSVPGELSSTVSLATVLSLAQLQGPFAVVGEEGVEAAYKKALQISAATQKKVRSSNADLVDSDRENKKRFIQLDIPLDISMSFSNRIQSEKPDLKLSDWDLVRALLKSQTFSLSQSPSLVSQAMDAGRLDILLDVARSCQDLSEKGAVGLLVFTVSVPHTVLVRWGLSKGLLVPTYAKEKSAPVAKSKKEVEPVEVNGKVFEKVTSIHLLQLMAKALIQRKSAFVSIRLSEVIMQIPPMTAITILKVFMQFSDGICNEASDASYYNEDFTDKEIRRSLCWSQAILDSHYSSITLNAISHPETRKALVGMADTLRDIDKANDVLDSLNALWSHVTRPSGLKKAGGLGEVKVYGVEVLRL